MPCELWASTSVQWIKNAFIYSNSLWHYLGMLPVTPQTRDVIKCVYLSIKNWAECRAMSSDNIGIFR